MTGDGELHRSGTIRVIGSGVPHGMAWPNDSDRYKNVLPSQTLSRYVLSLLRSKSPAQYASPPLGRRHRMSGYASIRSAQSDTSSRPNSTASMSRRPRRKENGHHGQASWLSSVINLVNTIVGAGVLAMPSALSNMGIFLGIFVWHYLRLRSLPTNTMRKIPGSWKRQFLRSESNHIPQCCRHLRRCYRYQVFRCRHQLSHHHW